MYDTFKNVMEGCRVFTVTLLLLTQRVETAAY